MLDSQESRPDFQCGQGVKHENLMGQDLDPGRRWKYRCLCSVPPPPPWDSVLEEYLVVELITFFTVKFGPSWRQYIYIQLPYKGGLL